MEQTIIKTRAWNKTELIQEHATNIIEQQHGTTHNKNNRIEQNRIKIWAYNKSEAKHEHGTSKKEKKAFNISIWSLVYAYDKFKKKTIVLSNRK